MNSIMEKQTKIVRYKGGLGNQMFQYAFSCMLKDELNQGDILADFSAYQTTDYSGIRVPRILKMNVEIDIATDWQLNNIYLFNHPKDSLCKKFKIILGFESLFNKKIYHEWNRAWVNPLKILNYEYYDGYWQSWRYLEKIEPKLRNDFTLKSQSGEKTRKFSEEYKNINSVMVGIRRGDYLQDSKHFGVFDESYYLKGMKYISDRIENPVFIIFSNDIEWVKENMDFKNHRIVYRAEKDQDSDLEELMVMSACRHAIIVNSTFQWWGAWLNSFQDKIIIAPQKWFFDNKPIDIIPPTWIRM